MALFANICTSTASVCLLLFHYHTEFHLLCLSPLVQPSVGIDFNLRSYTVYHIGFCQSLCFGPPPHTHTQHLFAFDNVKFNACSSSQQIRFTYDCLYLSVSSIIIMRPTLYGFFCEYESSLSLLLECLTKLRTLWSLELEGWSQLDRLRTTKCV